MRKIIFILAFISCLVACSEKEDRTSTADFGIAISNVASEDYLLKLIDRRPGNARNYIRLASLYHETGDVNKAIDVLENALLENPGNEKAQLLLSKYYLEKGDINKAEENFLKLSDDNEGVEYSLVQAELLVDKGFYDKALQVLNRSMAKDKGNATLYYWKGVVQKNLSDTASALKNLKTAVQSENARFPMVVEYLDFLSDLGKSEEFFSSYKSLSPEIKSKPELKFVLSDILVELENPDSARAILYLVDEEPVLGEKYYKLAQIHFDQREYDSAIYYGELSFSKERDLNARLLVARAFDKRYNYAEAENTYLEILEADSTFAVAAEELDQLRRKVRYIRRQRQIEEQRKKELELIQPLTPINQPALPLDTL